MIQGGVKIMADYNIKSTISKYMPVTQILLSHTYMQNTIFNINISM